MTPGWAAVRLYHHKNKGGGLLMLIKGTIPFVNNTADPHLEQQGILIAIPNRQQLHIHNIYTPPRCSCSAGHNSSIAHLLSKDEMSLIVGDINAHHSRWDANTNLKTRTKSHRRNAQRSIQTNSKTDAGRQPNQMAILRRQMRPLNKHITSMAAS